MYKVSFVINIFIQIIKVTEFITFFTLTGLTLALTVIPMGIGYAALAGLPLQVRMFEKFSTRCYKIPCAEFIHVIL